MDTLYGSGMIKNLIENLCLAENLLPTFYLGLDWGTQGRKI